MDISLHGVTNVLITFSLVWIVAISMLMMKQAGGRRQVKKEPIHRRPIFGPPGSAGQRPPAAAFSETFVWIPCLPACLPACLPGQYLHLGLLGSSTSQALSQIVTCKWLCQWPLHVLCIGPVCLGAKRADQLHLFYDGMHFESERVLIHQVMLRFGRAHTLTSLTCQAAVSVDN